MTSATRRRRHPRTLTQQVRDLQAEVAALKKLLGGDAIERRAVAAVTAAQARGLR